MPIDTPSEHLAQNPVEQAVEQRVLDPARTVVAVALSEPHAQLADDLGQVDVLVVEAGYELERHRTQRRRRVWAVVLLALADPVAGVKLWHVTWRRFFGERWASQEPLRRRALSSNVVQVSQKRICRGHVQLVRLFGPMKAAIRRRFIRQSCCTGIQIVAERCASLTSCQP